MRLVCAAMLTLGAGAVWAQADVGPPTADDAVLAPETELPPRYRIEFIIFAHNRFDASEEYFDTVPPTSQFAHTDEPVPLRFFDADARQSLRELIEGPISAPPRDEPAFDELAENAEPPADSLDASQTDAELEAWLDPRLVEGPNTRHLDLDELTLLPTLDRLERLDAYTPLVHAGWEQNGLAEADAVPIDMMEFDTTNPRGTIRLHVSRYLHISVDLAYRDEPLTAEPDAETEITRFGSPAAPQATPFGFLQFEQFAEPQPSEYYLFEQRRILRDELNYFDHPAFGLLLQITLAPEPEHEPEPNADGPSA